MDYPKTHSNPEILFYLIFGLCCMASAGFILIMGMLSIGGDKSVLITVGLTFQIGESVCFIVAARMVKNKGLRTLGSIALMLGYFIFAFSIGVMTMAQKSALQIGEAKDRALVSQIHSIESQINTLQNLIDGYNNNAEKQSKSIYKDSRALGQDSLNRAVEMSDKIMLLMDRKSDTISQRQQTSSRFFAEVEELTGLPAAPTEFWLMFIRSLLLEGLGIFFLYTSSRLWTMTSKKPQPAGDASGHISLPGEPTNDYPTKSSTTDIMLNKPVVVRNSSQIDENFVSLTPVVAKASKQKGKIGNSSNHGKIINIRHSAVLAPDLTESEVEFENLVGLTLILYNTKKIKTLGRDAILYGLKKTKPNLKLSAGTAKAISLECKSRLKIN